MNALAILNTLIVGLTKSQTDSLEHVLKESGLSVKVTKAPTIAGLEQRLSSESFDLCLLHESLGESQQQRVLEFVQTAGSKIRTAMIPVSRSDARDVLLNYIRAGAHGIVIAPARADAVAKVVNTALTSRRSLSSAKSPTPSDAKEEISSLPWILETVAAKLERVSELIEAKQPKAEEIPASAKLVKEALLGSIAGTPEFDEAALEDFVTFLVEHSAAAKGK